MMGTVGNFTNGKLLDKLVWDAVVAAAANRIAISTMMRFHDQLYWDKRLEYDQYCLDLKPKAEAAAMAEKHARDLEAAADRAQQTLAEAVAEACHDAKKLQLIFVTEHSKHS